MAGSKQTKPRSGGAFSFPKELRGKLSEVNEDDPQKRTHGRIIVDKIVLQAEQGNVKAQGEILDRLHGKPAQSMTLDANIVTTREEHVQSIFETLAFLESDKDKKNGSGDKRVN
jgi:hypothetical protein